MVNPEADEAKKHRNPSKIEGSAGRVQICSDLFRFVQILFRFVQICSDLFRFVQILFRFCSDLFRFVQNQAVSAKAIAQEPPEHSSNQKKRVTDARR